MLDQRRCRRLFLATRSPLHGDEGGAKTVQARKVLVAARQVDLPLASEKCFLWLDRKAIGFHRTVAAPLADQLVDDRKTARVLERATLASTTLLRCAGLLIDE